ncbi:hypothetical protein K438DRAFT_1997739 [Mycena galopus ATCC 62051]|nr:hypothetical protein K438DRAFT_1997739 [Mycena galopus ATCC 62051]
MYAVKVGLVLLLLSLYFWKEAYLPSLPVSQKDYVKELTAEFCISSTLHHVNIVETVDLVQDEAGRWCEVTEFCPGGDVYAAIKKGDVSPSEAEYCFKQISSGVGHAAAVQLECHWANTTEFLFVLSLVATSTNDFTSTASTSLKWVHNANRMLANTTSSG